MELKLVPTEKEISILRAQKLWHMTEEHFKSIIKEIFDQVSKNHSLYKRDNDIQKVMSEIGQALQD